MSEMGTKETKLVYVKRWRTLVELPAKYADEIVESLRCSADSARLRDALDNSQSLLVMIDLVGPDSASWIKEDMRDLLTKQIVENRTSLSDPKRAEPQTAPKLEALESCKGEQLKFEEWAAAEKYDMHEHPLHYLFMDDKTNAARQGWKAALRYAATVIAGAQCQAVSAPLASNASDPLETLEGNCWDLRCIDIPTGGGDADIGWNIVEHHMGPPKERIVGRGRSPREALQDATSTLSRPLCGGES